MVLVLVGPMMQRCSGRRWVQECAGSSGSRSHDAAVQWTPVGAGMCRL